MVMGRGWTSRFNIVPNCLMANFFPFLRIPFFYILFLLLLHQQLPAFSFPFLEYILMRFFFIFFFLFVAANFPPLCSIVFSLSVTFSFFASIVIQTFPPPPPPVQNRMPPCWLPLNSFFILLYICIYIKKYLKYN